MTTVLKLNQKNGFNSLLENFFQETPALNQNNRFNPQVNVSETKDAFILEVNAPGREKENFDIKLDKNLLTISYQAKQQPSDEKVKIISREFSRHAFTRTFTVDQKLIADDITAKYENGILMIILPKKEEVKISPRQIAII
jgi:HSP20 family protein